jgi:hypothetical protein
MSPRRARANGQSRQQIAVRLRDRRVREETLIVEAADALARRSTAESEVAAAMEVLTGALTELEHLGFALPEVAQLLEVDPSILAGTGPARRSSARGSRQADGQMGGSADEDRPD